LARVKRESPEVKRLKTRVRNLKSNPAESVPKTELDSLRATLEAKLTRSVPKEEADALQARLKEMESKLGESIPRREAEAQLESTRSELRREIEELERRLNRQYGNSKGSCRDL
jgi:exonuclease VII large subunit